MVLRVKVKDSRQNVLKKHVLFMKNFQSTSLIDIRQIQPSFLLGTIDKFALMPWSEDNGKIFGARTANNPPSLIIQDELHLISGPLGTISSIYEAAFDLIMRKRLEDKGPKYIASSATIRNTTSQVLRMYGRKASIFPSLGFLMKTLFSKLNKEEEKRDFIWV